ncbi:PREDICTED: uncharacterized protein LOC104704906 [Camelina sativa]|uniref:Uncharacterized protein LOC104704906 n=1 Tax=Camelina sativa TaxID=90675 RepID=A0ABM0T120_CAMSA|nr:PREDICTED: uncharacterized protein LOC104704906 [Camelina sativa]
MSIVTEILTGDNYNTWIITMRTSLEAKNKISFVDGSLPRPHESDPLHKIWIRCNSMVKAWMLNVVSKQIYDSILYFQDAAGIWEDLHRRFHKSNLPQIYNLEQEISSLRQGNMSLSEYYTKKVTLWERLACTKNLMENGGCRCSQVMKLLDDYETTRITQFLMGLNDDFTNIRGQILNMKPRPSLSDMYNMLESDESQRQRISTKPNPSAFQVKAQVNAYQPKGFQKPQTTCAHCGLNGHTIDVCYKIHGFPPGWKPKNQRQNSNQRFNAPAAANLALTESGSEYDREKALSPEQLQYLVSYLNSKLQPQQSAGHAHTNSSTATITEITSPGSSGLNPMACQMTEKMNSWVIDTGATHHVTHDKNLFQHMTPIQDTTVKLANGVGVRIQGLGNIRLNDKLLLTDDLTKGLMIGRGRLHNKLYFLDLQFQPSDQAIPTFCVSVKSDFHTWHQRLGHPSTQKLKYFLTIVDDHSRATWVYLLRNKSEAITVLPGFVSMVETQFDTKIKAVRSDNAPEFNFTKFYREKGIVSYHSCPETPQQNSVVERKHQHLLNVARLPTEQFSNKSPFEILMQKPPEYDALRTFGCLAYASTSPQQRHKFAPRARASIFLGYLIGIKGYKLLDIETHDVFVSRHVIFHEELFPLAIGDMKQQIQDLFPSVSDFGNGLAVDKGSVIIPKAHKVTELQDSVEDVSAVEDSASITHMSKPNPENAVAVEDSVTVNADMSSDNDELTEMVIDFPRKTKQPAYLQDYHCYHVSTDILYPLCHYLSYDKLSGPYHFFLTAISREFEPTTYSKAMKHIVWTNAMGEEITALEATNTWSICSLPAGKHVIGCKWVYKVKYHSDGTLDDIKLDWWLKDTLKKKLDISNAFLNGDLDEEIYMRLPPGYASSKGDSLPPNAVCKLNKSLYGLKQTSRQWYLKFAETLQSLGFLKNHSDHTLFTKVTGSILLIVLVYVDDIIISSNNDTAADELKT